METQRGPVSEHMPCVFQQRENHNITAIVCEDYCSNVQFPKNQQPSLNTTETAALYCQLRAVWLHTKALNGDLMMLRSLLTTLICDLYYTMEQRESVFLWKPLAGGQED